MFVNEKSKYAVEGILEDIFFFFNLVFLISLCPVFIFALFRPLFIILKCEAGEFNWVFNWMVSYKKWADYISPETRESP